jgi:hypothetical protein
VFSFLTWAEVPKKEPEAIHSNGHFDALQLMGPELIYQKITYNYNYFILVIVIL